MIRTVSATQKELVQQGKIQQSSKYKTEDGQWSEGLVSAAKMVAAATNELCDAANTLVKGISSEEKLIGAAQQVASSTAQLVLACKVKADRGSEKMKGLETASRSVRKATDTLIKSAKDAKEAADKEAEQESMNSEASESVVDRLKKVSNLFHILKNFTFDITKKYYVFLKIMYFIPFLENTIGRRSSESRKNA